ncbi:hypothetical protein [Halocatena pleomorpha]|uniref:Hsp20/alpha crystallin family protein n=1 Tax=Halocatena pleomorpha TaxID=1785090 RepID=A0A3P3RAU1_9EURY|nr:hypothetical protein [Halocatena pleomorpha]RRJ29543.1 hypothetical protein EIK79_12975 [Halocatena pleomorpha]
MTNDDNQSDHGIGSLFNGLLGVLTETDGRYQGVNSGDTDIGRTCVGHEFSIGIGTLADSEIERRSISVPTQSNPTTVRYDDIGAVVVVDLCDENITPEELAGGITDMHGEPIFVVATGRELIARVPLRHGDFEVVDARFNNGVLEIRLQRRNDTNK